MLIPLKDLQKKYRMEINGILHVGAHKAEELLAYAPYDATTFWVEANKDLYDDLMRRFGGSHTNFPICAVVGDINGQEVKFNIANNGQSSSILELGTHKQAHPEVHYISEEVRYMERLDGIMDTYNIPSETNFINLDIQGAELLALRGLGEKLPQFDYIYSEVNVQSLYDGCCLLRDLDAFLSGGYDRVETEIIPQFGWGDAFWRHKRLAT